MTPPPAAIATAATAGASAAFVAILGERELADKTVTVRRSSDRLEKTIPVADLAGWLTRLDDAAG